MEKYHPDYCPYCIHYKISAPPDKEFIAFCYGFDVPIQVDMTHADFMRCYSFEPELVYEPIFKRRPNWTVVLAWLGCLLLGAALWLGFGLLVWRLFFR